MIAVQDGNQNEHTFDITEYRGQDYDSNKYALTVAMVENVPEVWLVPLDPNNGRLKIEELHKYLMLIYGRWEKTHTLYKTQYCDFVRPIWNENE